MSRMMFLLPLVVTIFLSACDAPPHPADLPPQTAQQLAELTTGILALGPNVDVTEAKRAAKIAFEYPRQLAIEYRVTDPPLVHNAKVNAGLRTRGLCWHWAQDLERRLTQENFKTLDLHRAIANSRKSFRIEHSTVIISQKGDTLYQGLVLDPWRNGGLLYWGSPQADTRYDWLPAQLVLDERAAEQG